MKGLFIEGDKKQINEFIELVRPLIGEGINAVEINPIILSQATKKQVENRLEEMEE